MPRKVVKTKFFFEEDYVESIGEVSTLEFKEWDKNENLKYVGKPISRIDGYDKVSGSALYTFDIVLPKMKHAKILGSVFPNALIKKIDISKATALNGVIAILTSDNIKKINWFNNTTVLFDKHVRCVGDEIAAVVAESEAIAEQALSLIQVEYEQLPFLTSAAQALNEDKIKVHDSGNILNGKPDTYSRGNVEEGFKQAEIIVEDTYTTQVVIHNPTEVMCSVVNWDGDKLTVYDSTQGIFSVRDAVAGSLGISASNVRVIKKYMGGAFGCKLEAGKYTVIASLLAKQIGAPVRIILDRKQMGLIAGNRPDSVQKLKLGMKKDGAITAMTMESFAAVGAYPNGGNCSGPFRAIYKCDNMTTKESSVFINAGRARAYRAPGHVQGTFALESLIDDAAEKAGMDPLEFRLKNYSEMDQIGNKPYTSKLLKEAYQKGALAIGWNTKRKAENSDSHYIKSGIGMATQIWPGGGAPPAYVILKLNRDFSADVLAGSQDIGTGTYTFVNQIAAEVLEMPMERIKVTLGDTGVVPYGPASGGSMTAPSISPAVRDAAEQMKSKLIASAAVILEVPEEQLFYKEGTVTSKVDAAKKISASDIMRRLREQVLVTTGARNANTTTHTISTFGAQFAHVEVNTETGKIVVKKIVAAHDIGRVLNRKTLENQFHGGIIQGLGFALMEERILDESTGHVLNTNMHSYKIPTVMDTPEIEIITVGEGDPLISNTGVKGIGEPAIIPTAAAIANAVYNAIGVRIKSLPITPDKILNALYKNS